MRGPCLNKWIGHIAHLEPLLEAFPSSVFVRVRRDPRWVAPSVLRMRIDFGGDAAKSVSRTPPGFAIHRRAPPIEQVCEYVLAVETALDGLCDRIGDERFFELSYDALCQSPRRLLRDFGEWYEARAGVRLETRGDIPEHFTPSPSRCVSEQEFAAILAFFSGAEKPRRAA